MKLKKAMIQKRKRKKLSPRLLLSQSQRSWLSKTLLSRHRDVQSAPIPFSNMRPRSRHANKSKHRKKSSTTVSWKSSASSRSACRERSLDRLRTAKLTTALNLTNSSGLTLTKNSILMTMMSQMKKVMNSETSSAISIF